MADEVKSPSVSSDAADAKAAEARNAEAKKAAASNTADTNKPARDESAPAGLVQTPGIAKPDDNYREEAENRFLDDARDARERPVPESTISEMEAGQKALEKHQPRKVGDRIKSVEEMQELSRNTAAPRNDELTTSKPKVAEGQDPANPNRALPPGTAEMNTPSYRNNPNAKPQG